MTDRATRARPDAPGLPTEPAHSVQVYLNALQALGYDKASLMRAAGLTDAELADPDERIACTRIGSMFGCAMQERPLKNLGMRLAQVTPIGAYPLVDYVVLTSETVGQGLEQLARYFRLVAAMVALDFSFEDGRIRATFHGPPSAIAYEFAITLSLLHFREETDGRVVVESVSFEHAPDDVSEIERVLGCPVRPRASWTGWTMTREAWNLPLRRHDPVLGGVLRHHASDMVRRMPATTGMTSGVRQALASRVAGGDTRVQAVARALAMSVRSLQRRLSDEGCSYQDLVDLMRREAAERYLKDSSLSIAEVGFLLGYSEAAAFHRAFKRWTGLTPLAFRQQRS
ncbi:MAG TPA: AraC family transcriptional regulator ligand-binding domain-containing protein [Vicinamibacterales bacterium]|nr:AraC family transcriptional regulator ligand-binding domain-containing protein [Vicinamibacterales bacterium]